MVNCCKKKKKQAKRGSKSRGGRKRSRKSEVFNDFLKTDEFYEIYDFQNRDIRKNWSKFWEFYRSGCTHINNVFASLSYVSVFAFVDKEGIISEMSKFVDEVAVIDKKEQKVVLDMIHDTHAAREEEIYSFENQKLYKDNREILKSLGLAFMCARNPKETDTEKQMREIFSKKGSQSNVITSPSGNGMPFVRSQT
jgi:hypothetical protein